jgi:hypothetical protein
MEVGQCLVVAPHQAEGLAATPNEIMQRHRTHFRLDDPNVFGHPRGDVSLVIGMESLVSTNLVVAAAGEVVLDHSVMASPVIPTI